MTEIPSLIRDLAKNDKQVTNRKRYFNSIHYTNLSYSPNSSQVYLSMCFLLLLRMVCTTGAAMKEL